jgi:hypothetical protein
VSSDWPLVLEWNHLEHLARKFSFLATKPRITIMTKTGIRTDTSITHVPEQSANNQNNFIFVQNVLNAKIKFYLITWIQ